MTSVKSPKEMVRVFVWTKPRCQACRATYRRLELADVPVHVIPLADAPDIEAFAADASFTAAPVVMGVHPNGAAEWWCGFDEKHIDRFVDLAAEQPVPYELTDSVEVRDA